jgi:hypothetical protein
MRDDIEIDAVSQTPRRRPRHRRGNLRVERFQILAGEIPGKPFIAKRRSICAGQICAVAPDTRGVVSS